MNQTQYTHADALTVVKAFYQNQSEAIPQNIQDVLDEWSIATMITPELRQKLKTLIAPILSQMIVWKVPG